MSVMIRGLVTAAAFAALIMAAPAKAETTKEQLVGTWNVQSFKAQAGDKIGHPLGEKPVGFTGNRIWVMLIDSSRAAPASAALTDAEANALMKTNAAYTGKYEIDPTQTPDGIKITITVDSAANQGIHGAKRVLFLRVDGNRLVAKSPAIVVPTTGQTSVVQLEFVKAE